MSARPSSDKQRSALKLATLGAVTAAGGGAALAENKLVRVNATMLTLYGAPQEERRFTPVDVALDLDLAAGQPFHARALASAQGYDLHRREGPAAPALALSLSDGLRLLREARDVEACVLEGMEDSKFTGSEKRAFKSELAELRAALDELEAKVDAS